MPVKTFQQRIGSDGIEHAGKELQTKIHKFFPPGTEILHSFDSTLKNPRKPDSPTRLLRTVIFKSKQVVMIAPAGIPLKEIERFALLEALKMSNWVQKDAAELLAISSRVMNYKIKIHSIEIPPGLRLQGRRPQT